MTLALLAWVVGCFFLRGDLGKYLDDCTLTLVEPATGRIAPGAHPWQDYAFFWRPLHLVLLYGLNTAFWRWDAAIHFVAAACHGWCAWMLYRFLRAARPRGSPHAAGAAAVLFLVCPVNFQVAFWPSTVSTAIGAGMLLWLARRAAIGFAETGRGEPTRRRPSRAVTAAGLSGAAAFVCACFYEQPAAAFLAVPALMLGWRGVRVAMRWRIACVHGAAIAAGLGAYWLLLRWTAPEFARGSGESIAGVGALTARIGGTFEGAVRAATGERTRELVRGAWLNGVEALSNPMGIALVATLALAAVVWAWDVGRGDEPGGTPGRVPAEDAGVVWWAVLLFGAAVVVWSLLPVALVEAQRVQHRLLYVPLIGVAVGAWAVMGRAEGAIGFCRPLAGARGLGLRALRVTAGLAIGATVVASSVCLVGFQALYRQRWVLDERQMKQLVQALPDVPEGTVLVPLRLRDAAAGTGVEAFDGFLRSVFETGWTARARARAAFARADVWSMHLAGSGAVPLEEFDERGARYRSVPTIYEKLLAEREGWDMKLGVEVPYAKMVPFTTVKGGDVELVWKLTVVGADGARREITFPLVERAVRERGARHGEFRLGEGR